MFDRRVLGKYAMSYLGPFGRHFWRMLLCSQECTCIAGMVRSQLLAGQTYLILFQFCLVQHSV